MLRPGIKNPVIALLDFILPRICVACSGKLTPEEDVICTDCSIALKQLPDDKILWEYKRKFQQEGIISGLISLYSFEKDTAVQQLIHSAKYEKRFQNGYFLGKLLGQKIQNCLPDWQIDFIVPVPLHRLKKTERGYNQSYYISKGISKVTNIRVEEKLLKRIRYTESQTLLTMTERQHNVKNAFKVTSDKKIQGRNILIIDDVITSGSTISECAKVLLHSGAEKVYIGSAALA